MQAVPGQVFLDGVVKPVIMKPQLTERGLESICNFNPRYDDHIFQGSGPHIEVICSADEFLKAIQPGKTVDFSTVREDRALGTIDMLRGRAACDFPGETRLISSLDFYVERKCDSTKYNFRGKSEDIRLFGRSPDSIHSQLPAMLFELWFEIDDHRLSDFVPTLELRNRLCEILGISAPGTTSV